MVGLVGLRHRYIRPETRNLHQPGGGDCVLIVLINSEIRQSNFPNKENPWTRGQWSNKAGTGLLLGIWSELMPHFFTLIVSRTTKSDEDLDLKCPNSKEEEVITPEKKNHITKTNPLYKKTSEKDKKWLPCYNINEPGRLMKTFCFFPNEICNSSALL